MGHMVKSFVTLALGLALLIAFHPRIAQSQQPQPPSFAPDFYRIRVQEHGYGRAETLVLFRRLNSNAQNGPRWLVERRERTSRPSVSATGYAWIDSANCIDVAVVLRRLDSLPPAVVRGPSSMPTLPSSFAFHQPVVTLEASPVNYGGAEVRLSIEDRTVGPVAKWWFESRDVLRDCWREGGAVLDGNPISPGLPEIDDWRD